MGEISFSFGERKLLLSMVIIDVARLGPPPRKRSAPAPMGTEPDMSVH